MIRRDRTRLDVRGRLCSCYVRTARHSHYPGAFRTGTKSSIHALANNPLDAAIVKSIVTVARAISVRTVAEYVGDQKILEIVSKLGVDASQGWAFGPPLPIAEFFAALAPEVAGANVTPLYPRRALQNV